MRFSISCAKVAVGTPCQVTFQRGRRCIPNERNWRKNGTWVKIHDHLRQWVRLDRGRQASPSETIIDSQSIKSAAMVSQDVGFDGGEIDSWTQTIFERRYLGVGTTSVRHCGKHWRTRRRQTATQTSQPDGQSSLSSAQDLGRWWV